MTDEELDLYIRRHTTFEVFECNGIATCNETWIACYYDKQVKKARIRARHPVSVWGLCRVGHVVKDHSNPAAIPNHNISIQGNRDIHTVGPVTEEILPYGWVKGEMVCLKALPGYLGLVKNANDAGTLYRELAAYEESLEPDPQDKVGLLMSAE